MTVSHRYHTTSICRWGPGLSAEGAPPWPRNRTGVGLPYVWVCVIYYIYPATFSPNGHGSSSLFTCFLFCSCPSPALSHYTYRCSAVIVGLPILHPKTADSRIFGRWRKLQFLVKWLGYDRPTWEKTAGVDGLQAIDRFPRPIPGEARASPWAKLGRRSSRVGGRYSHTFSK